MNRNQQFKSKVWGWTWIQIISQVIYLSIYLYLSLSMLLSFYPIFYDYTFQSMGFCRCADHVILGIAAGSGSGLLGLLCWQTGTISYGSVFKGLRTCGRFVYINTCLFFVYMYMLHHINMYNIHIHYLSIYIYMCVSIIHIIIYIMLYPHMPICRQL